MAIEQPLATDPLNLPDHSLLHRIIASDLSAPVKSIAVDSSGNISLGDLTNGNYTKIDPNGVHSLEGTAKRHLSMRPTMMTHKIKKVLSEYEIVPTMVDTGSSTGFSLPVYVAGSDEEIHFNEYIVGRWDGASNIVCSVIGYLSAGVNVNDDFNLQLSWSNKSASSGIFPSTTTDVPVVTNIATDRNAQYSIYKVDFTVDWDLNDPDIAASDIWCARLRRIAVGGGDVEMSAEFVVIAVMIQYVVDKMYKA